MKQQPDTQSIIKSQLIGIQIGSIIMIYPFAYSFSFPMLLLLSFVIFVDIHIREGLFELFVLHRKKHKEFLIPMVLFFTGVFVIAFYILYTELFQVTVLNHKYNIIIRALAKFQFYIISLGVCILQGIQSTAKQHKPLKTNKNETVSN